MRYSKQRELVHTSIMSSKDHPTANRIFSEVKKEIPKISFGTVYRNLGQLVEHGFIRIIQLDGITHYDGNVDPHNHFICNECNRIYDFELDNEDFISQVEVKNHHHVSGYQLLVTGTCNKCNIN